MAKQIRSRHRKLFGFFVFATIIVVFQNLAQAQSIPTTLGWHQIPNTTLRSVCPSPSSYPQIQGNSGCDSIVEAWSGGAFDSTHNRLIMMGGGHNDYAGNEVYAVNLATLTSQRLNNPSTGIRDGCTSGGTYSDGRPVARHTYNHLDYLPNQNAVFLWGGSQWQCGGFSGQTWLFNLSSLSWSQQSSSNGPRSGFGRGIAYDSNSGLVYARDDQDLFSFNPTTNAWTKRSSAPAGLSDYKTGLIDPVRKKYFLQVEGQSTLYWYDISSPTASTSLSKGQTSGCAGFIGHYKTGWAHDPVQNKIVGWDGGNIVYILNPDTLTCSTVSHSGGPPAVANGTFGRFRYSPSLNVFVVCNSMASNCYALRLTSGSGPPPPPPPSSFNFALSNGGDVSGTQGQTFSNSITATLVSGTTQPAGFSVSGLPTGATGAFSQTSCSPNCSTTLNISTLSTTPPGNHTINITSVAGSLTKTTSFILTVSASGGVPPPVGSASFQTRCSQGGVIKCVGFDSQSDITGTYGDIHGTLPGNSTPVLDSTVKASGNSSIKFTIPSNSGANSSGSYFTNFSDTLTTQFGGNSEFYIQWRQRFSPEFLSTTYQGGGGWKHSIIGTGDKPGCTASQSASGLCYSSCTALETVTQNTFHRGFAQMYNSCTGSASHGPYNAFEQGFGGSDFKLQNARPSPYCLYSQKPNNFLPPSGNCLGYFPNEWMTFQVHIKTGPRVNNEFTNSFVQLWIARENQPSELVINWGPYNLSAGSASENQQYGKVWLLPYNTGKSSAQSHPTAYTWYDELIISTSKIADPVSGGGGGGGGGGTVTPPAAPSALSIQ